MRNLVFCLFSLNRRARSSCVSFRCAWLRLLLELLPLPAHQYLIRGLAAICHAPPLEGAAAGARRAAR